MPLSYTRQYGFAVAVAIGARVGQLELVAGDESGGLVAAVVGRPELGGRVEPVPVATVIARRLDGQTNPSIVRRMAVALSGMVVGRLKLISL